MPKVWIDVPKDLALKESTIDAIAAVVAKGGSVALALRLLELKEATYYKYLRHARDWVEREVRPPSASETYIGRLEYLYFTITSANAKGEMWLVEQMLSNVDSGGPQSQRAIEFMLKHRYRWSEGPREVVHRHETFGVTDDSTAEDDVTRMSERELRRLAAGESVVDGEIIDE